MITDYSKCSAVVTGGANGIGLATARLLLERGARVVIADVRPEALDRAVSDLTEVGEVHGVVCDVSKQDEVSRLADEAFNHLGAVNLAFHNAGVGIGGPLLHVTDEDWKIAIDVDLWSAIYGVQAFTERMLETGTEGHVLFTSSFAGLVPNDGLGPYCVAKYGVVALAEVLHRELRQTPLGVSVLCPMVVNTHGYSQFIANTGGAAMNEQRWYWGPPRDGEPEDDLPDGRDDEGLREDLSGDVLPPRAVAEVVLDAVEDDRLYVLPHEASRAVIRRRFERIDATFDRQAARGV